MPMEALSSDLFIAVMTMVLGFVLMAIELTILPGFGVIGFLGLAVLGYGCWKLADIGGAELGIIGAVAGLLVFGVVARSFFRSRKGKALVLEDEVQGTAVDALGLHAMVGETGRVRSALRPSGIVEVRGQRFDAFAGEGDFLPAEALVEVVGHEHGQLRVVAQRGDSEKSSEPGKP